MYNYRLGTRYVSWASGLPGGQVGAPFDVKIASIRGNHYGNRYGGADGLTSHT